MTQRLHLPNPRCWLPWLLAAAGWLGLPRLVLAQTYIASSTTYAWESVSSTAIANCDDCASAVLSIGFNFPVGNGTTYSQLYVNTNGLITFGTATTALNNVALPNATSGFSPSFAPFWDDLITTVTYSTLGSSPTRRMVINWKGTLFANTSYGVEFQVVLYETGLVEYRYKAMGCGCAAASATIGMQLTGTDGLNYGASPAIGITSNASAIRLTPRSSASPGGVTGASWWSRATALALANGNNISSWTNDANYGRNLTAGTTKPVYRNNNGQNINFNPVVEFTATTASDAAAQYFQASSLMGTANYNAMYAAVVGYPTSSGQQNALFHEQMATPGGEGEGRLTFHFPWLTSELYWDAGSCCVSNRVFVPSSTTVNAPSVILMTKDDSAYIKQSIRQNGTVLANTTASRATATGNNSMFRVGYNSATPSYPFRGLLAEGLLHAGTSLTATQIGQIESYLGIKYGATLGGNGATTTAYYDSGGATVWTANTGFHNNVTVVGRNDGSGLDQRISRSINSGTQVTLSTSTSAALPTGASTVSAQAGTAFSADRSFVALGDDGGTASSTSVIASGALGGYTRSARAWRLQVTGTAPTQITLCVPDSLLPASLTTGTVVGALASDTGFTSLSATAVATAGSCPGSGYGVTASVSGRVVQLPAAALGASGTVRYFTLARLLPPDHLAITASSATGLTCQSTTFTVTACADAACSVGYTSGLSGNLALSGTGMTVNYPSGAGFSMAVGSSTATVVAQVTTAGSVTVSASGLSQTPTNAQPVFCGLGVAAASGNACSFTAADAGLLFDVPAHRAETSTSFSVMAVKKSDNSLACTPAFASVSKSITFRCSYSNPSTGTLPARIGGAALNAANNATAACDGTGRAVSLSFDATGTASTTFLYADVGQLGLTASYTGSGSDAGLSMTGTDSTIVAPYDFAISGLPGSAVAAGGSFSATVTARNTLGNTTPNFGREASAEGVKLGVVRTQPTGSGAAYGSFSGTAGSFSGGVATSSNLTYSEVGRVNVMASLASNSYLGSGLAAAGSSEGSMVWCAAENGTCTLPGGATASVYYGDVVYGSYATVRVLSGITGSLGCNNATFGDPYIGYAKACWYVVTTGGNANTVGAVILRPHHFDVSVTQGCSSFTYAGQPLLATVQARNAAGSITTNYDGSATTSPSFAKAVTLAEVTAMGVGSWSGASIAAAGFTAGVGSATPTYTFTNKLTSSRTPVLRATDTDGVSSSGYTEPTLELRSGRLRLSNAFGKATASLSMPLTAEYWGGNAWVLNSADSCTALAAASVATSNPRNALGNASTATTSAGAVSLVAGQGSISFAAPSPAGSSVSFDVSLNLGATTADQSCAANHPATTGAAKAWLRSSNGSCSALSDRDPSGRISFGIYSPETRKSVHVRELY